MHVSGHYKGRYMRIGRHIRNENGSVVLMALFLVIFISILMITVELMRLSDLESVTNMIKDMEASYCAEAAIEYGLYTSRNNPAWPSTAAAVDVTLGPVDCAPGGPPPASNIDIDTGWTFTLRVQNDKADPNFPLYNYVYFTGKGITDVFTRRIRAEIRRTNQSTTPRYYQIRRWQDL